MKRDDPRQISMFDAEPDPVTVKRITASAPREFDSRKLQIIDDQGDGCVVENSLGEALGYAEAKNVQRLIDRLEKRPSWGSSRHRVALIVAGKGARREVRQRLLTEKQVILVCMACELPNIDEVQSLIADVFIAWRHGRLTAVDAETTTTLTDATDAAFNAAPELMNQLAALAANDNKIVQMLETITEAVIHPKGRRHFSKEQRDLYARVLDRWYGGVDPAIGRFKLTDGSGHLLEHPAVEVDHYNDLSHDNSTENGWPLSPEAHQRKHARENFRADFDKFQKHRLELEQIEAADAKKQPEFEF
ncbi:MAG TPA: hypothetical protein VNH19_17525 [Candidatus Limnocylindrales bacterium]|nr:hypothetical protein [Bryobacteraceae bacterium]HXJ14080.1 hypothetical protein [Candidatus Limnocylindrales bacterium]